MRSKPGLAGRGGAEELSGDFYYLAANDWVTVIPLIRNQQSGEYDMILVEQFRHGSEQVVLEFPAGVIDSGEGPRESALREMAEETGYRPESVLRCEQLGSSYPNPAIMSNRTFTYGVLLDETALPQEQQLDGLESLEVHRMAIGQLKELALDQEAPFNSALMLQSLFWLENSEFYLSLL